MIGTFPKTRLGAVAVLAATAAPLLAQTPQAELRGHSERIEALGFSSDGKTLASGGIDRALILWDVQSGRQASFRTPSGPVPARLAGPIPILALAFAPEPPADPLRLGARHRPERATVAAIGSDRSILLWDVVYVLGLSAALLLSTRGAVRRRLVG